MVFADKPDIPKKVSDALDISAFFNLTDLPLASSPLSTIQAMEIDSPPSSSTLNAASNNESVDLSQVFLVVNELELHLFPVLSASEFDKSKGSMAQEYIENVIKPCIEGLKAPLARIVDALSKSPFKTLAPQAHFLQESINLLVNTFKIELQDLSRPVISAGICAEIRKYVYSAVASFNLMGLSMNFQDQTSAIDVLAALVLKQVELLKDEMLSGMAPPPNASSAVAAHSTDDSTFADQVLASLQAFNSESTLGGGTETPASLPLLTDLLLGSGSLSPESVLKEYPKNTLSDSQLREYFPLS